MVSFPTSEPTRVTRGELTLLRRIVHGDAHTAGLATVLPLLQSRAPARTEDRAALVQGRARAPPRAAGADPLDAQGGQPGPAGPADVHAGRAPLARPPTSTRTASCARRIEAVEERLRALVDDGAPQVATEATDLLRELEGARRRALVPGRGRRRSAAPACRAPPSRRTRCTARVMAIRAELAG